MGAVKGKKLDPVGCPFCEFSSKRLTSFESHLVEAHGKKASDVWIETNGKRTCKCGCGGETRWLGWKQGFSDYVNGHNANLGHLGDEGEKIKQTRRDTLKKNVESGAVVNWAKGKTKETNEILANAATKRSVTVKRQFETGERVPWLKGLSKDTDDRVKRFSDSIKEGYKSGRFVPWARGLKKETSPKIRKMAMSVSISLKREHIRLRLDGFKRLKNEDIISRIESSGNLTVVGGLEMYINDLSPVIQVRCNSCGAVNQDSLRRLFRGRCFSCMPNGSAAQQEISAFIRSLGVETKDNVRSALNGLEIDSYVPSKCFGVEYNGLYWHSELHKSSTYHENKTQQAVACGISLVQIFEDDWRDRRPVVESILRHRLGLTPKRIGARKLNVKRLSVLERRNFFNDNHIDGDVSCIVSWGLVDQDGQIVAALSLRKPFHKTHENSLEVARFCTVKNAGVSGGLSRLLKEAKNFCATRDIKSIITYVDNRLGGGRGYSAAGFKKIGQTPPRFWWTDFECRMNRFKFRADPSRGMTEAQVADEAGVVRIWGCSNLVYRLDL